MFFQEIIVELISSMCNEVNAIFALQPRWSNVDQYYDLDAEQK